MPTPAGMPSYRQAVIEARSERLRRQLQQLHEGGGREVTASARGSEPEPEPEPPHEPKVSSRQNSFVGPPPTSEEAEAMMRQAQLASLYQILREQIAPECSVLRRQLQLAADLLDCFRVHSKVPKPDDEGRILALGGAPLVKLDQTAAHGSLTGACIVEGGVLTGCEFKLRLNRLKKTSFPGNIVHCTDDVAASWQLKQLRDAHNFVLDGMDILAQVEFDAAAVVRGASQMSHASVHQLTRSLSRATELLATAHNTLRCHPTVGPRGLEAAQRLFTPPMPPGVILEFWIDGDSFVASVMNVVQTAGPIQIERYDSSTTEDAGAASPRGGLLAQSSPPRTPKLTPTSSPSSFFSAFSASPASSSATSVGSGGTNALHSEKKSGRVVGKGPLVGTFFNHDNRRFEIVEQVEVRSEPSPSLRRVLQTLATARERVGRVSNVHRLVLAECCSLLRCTVCVRCQVPCLDAFCELQVARNFNAVLGTGYAHASAHALVL